MYKKECKDAHARVCLSRLTRILDINMLEDLQQLEHTGNVATNLEIESNLKPQRSFFSKSSEKINKIMNRKGEKPTVSQNIALLTNAFSKNCELSVLWLILLIS